MGAVGALGSIGDRRAIEPLIEILKDQTSGVRGQAATVLGDFKDPRAIEPLIAALKAPGEVSSLTAATALAKIGSPAVESLIAALKDENSTVRYFAISALGDISDPRVSDLLLNALHDGDMQAVANAHRFFIKRNDPALQDALLQAFNQFGDVAMAEDFLNSGNPRLERTAEKWRTRQGYLESGDIGRKVLFRGD